MATIALPIIGAAANLIGGLYGASAAKRGAKNIKNAADSGINAEGAATGAANKGISTAVAAGQEGVSKAVATGQESSDIARQHAVENVSGATSAANAQLQGTLDTVSGNLDPYKTLGVQGTKGISDLLNNPYKLPTAEDVRNTPGYQFEQEQGVKALNQSAAASGALQTGGTLKALQKYGTGLADTYYQHAVQNSMAARGVNYTENAAATGTGLTAEGLYQNAALPLTTGQASNTLASGYYQGNTDIENAKYKAGLGMAGATTNAGYGISGAGAEASNTINEANNAVNLLLTGAGAQSAGMIGSANSLAGGITGAGNALANMYYFNKGAPNTAGPKTTNTNPWQYDPYSQANP